jgi:gluconolactonase
MRDMRGILLGGLFFSLLALAQAQTNTPSSPAAPSGDADALVKKIQDELMGPPLPESKVDPSVPHGEILTGRITDPKMYPGTDNGFQVYVPAQYDPARPACLLVRLDGLGGAEATVLDNLIAAKAIPVMIGVGITPGSIRATGGDPKAPAVRFNRSYEFDSMNDHFPDYVLNVLLPEVMKLKTKDGRAINISPDPNDRMVTGVSTGGIGSFTLAWRRPDQFSRVYTVIGTFVSMRGGHEYPALIRKTDPKPIRMFMEDGSTDAWNTLLGSWYENNLAMESALRFSGYDVAHAWGTHGHDGRPGATIFPDVMRWLWRDYPKRIDAGLSQNKTLQQITLPGEGWQRLPDTFQSAAGLAANAQGDVYISDVAAKSVSKFDASDKAAVFAGDGPGIVGEAFGPDGTLYGVVPGAKQIIALDPLGKSRVVADGIAGHGIVVTHDGTIYVTEPGEHSDMPSQIWQIKSTGEKKVIDQGLSAASGIAFSADGTLMFAAENSTKWIYSYVAQPDGSFIDKQPFYRLHMTDIPNDSGAEDLAVNTNDYLFAATRMGIQACDQNGRVRAILPLPTPVGPVRSLCFGGPKFDELYATDGVHVFKRHMKVAGYPQWSAPIKFPSEGGG